MSWKVAAKVDQPGGSTYLGVAHTKGLAEAENTKSRHIKRQHGQRITSVCKVTHVLVRFLSLRRDSRERKMKKTIIPSITVQRACTTSELSANEPNVTRALISVEATRAPITNEFFGCPSWCPKEFIFTCSPLLCHHSTSWGLPCLAIA